MTELKKRIKNHHDIDLSDDVAKIKAALFDATHDVKNKAGELFTESMDDLKERSSLAKDNIADYIVEKPFKSLGIALLTGVIIGYLFHK